MRVLVSGGELAYRAGGKCLPPKGMLLTTERLRIRRRTLRYRSRTADRVCSAPRGEKLIYDELADVAEQTDGECERRVHLRAHASASIQPDSIRMVPGLSGPGQLFRFGQTNRGLLLDIEVFISSAHHFAVEKLPEVGLG